MNLQETYKSLRAGANALALLSAGQKNAALESVKQSLIARIPSILAANDHDVMRAKERGLKESLIDRLKLTESRMMSIISSIDSIIQQTDPIGQLAAGWRTDNGLEIKQVRVPLGVAAIIYESRPNVTVDAFALAYKSGNAILLRGSSTAIESNKEIVAAIKNGLRNEEKSGAGIPNSVALATSSSHDEVDEILNAVGYIDVVLPRGGAELIKNVVSKAKIPVIETGSGICHLYVDETGNLEKAVAIAENAKLQRPGVCNAIECLLVHNSVAEEFLPMLYKAFNGRAEFRCDSKSFEILSVTAETNPLKKEIPCSIIQASETDFDTEFLDNILAVKVVSSVEEAINHINIHNTKHSETIVTESITNADLFQKKIDAACVYVNASTRFTDGEMFGFGAELGISTQKMHVRGPMGLTALTTTKYLIKGEGQIR